jgi:hypothetical protein
MRFLNFLDLLFHAARAARLAGIKQFSLFLEKKITQILKSAWMLFIQPSTRLDETIARRVLPNVPTKASEPRPNPTWVLRGGEPPSLSLEPFPISLSRVTLGFRRRRTISSVRRGACEGAGAEFIGGARGRA